MSRPKGSKNKIKEELKSVVVPKLKKEAVSVVSDLPETIMDPGPEPPKARKCNHAKERHFGGPFAELGGWCHEHGCDCMRYTNCKPQ